MATTVVHTRTDTVAESLPLEDKPTFADVAYVLMHPPPGEIWTTSERAYSLSALFAYTFLHPLAFSGWVNEVLGVRETLRVVGRPETLTRVLYNTAHAVGIIEELIYGPKKCPMALAKELGRKGKAPCPPFELEHVRVRWYPNLEATCEWPEDLGELWMDLPQTVDGGVDLRPAMDAWGMDNCYVIDPNRQPSALSRYPSEKLSGLAIKILLEDSYVIGVVEHPDEITQAARDVRAYIQDLPPLSHIARSIADAWPVMLGRAVRVTPGIIFHTMYTLSELTLWLSIDITRVLVLFLRPIFRVLVIALVLLLAPVLGVLCGAAAALAWLGRGIGLWILAILEATFLDEAEIARVEQQRQAQRVLENAGRSRRTSNLSTSETSSGSEMS